MTPADATKQPGKALPVTDPALADFVPVEIPSPEDDPASSARQHTQH